MAFSWKKVAAVVGLAGVAGLAPLSPAFAASSSVQLKLCNGSSLTQQFYPTGLNQNGDPSVWDDQPYATARSGACVTFNNWWWKTGQTIVVVRHKGDNPSVGAWSNYSFTIPASAPSGSTQVAYVY